MDTMEIARLSQLISNHEPDASDELKKLPSRCVQTAENDTLFNLAITNNNSDVISFLADDKEALDFAPEINPNLKKSVKLSASYGFSGVVDTEHHLLTTFGPGVCWERTPLLHAARCQNRQAISLLITKGAKVDVTDILGCSPAEICFELGGESLLQFFIDCCSQTHKTFKVTQKLLQDTLDKPAIYHWLVNNGKLEIAAKRMAFSLACASLNKQEVAKLISIGFDPEKLINSECNPIYEACTSWSLFVYKTPGYKQLAHLFARDEVVGIQGGSSLDENTLFAKDNSEPFEKLFTQFIRSSEQIDKLFSQVIDSAVDDLKERQKQPGVTKDELYAQLQLRINLVNYLMSNGISVKKTEAVQTFDFPDSIYRMGELSLLQCLLEHQFSLRIDDKYEFKSLKRDLASRGLDDIVNFLQTIHDGKPTKQLQQAARKMVTNSKWNWQLAGESTLNAILIPELPKADSLALIRITHSNSYGPDDNTTFSVRCIPEDGEHRAETIPWQEVTMVEELLDTDEGLQIRSDVELKPYDETPWLGTWEAKLHFHQGVNRIEIKVASSIEAMNSVISDWTLNTN